jgi:pimeloyl-ACP methyl ester carboxylesterase
MSTPRTLALPNGVEATTITTDRLTFAAHRARAAEPAALIVLVPGWTGSKEDFTPLLPLLAAAGYDAVAVDQRGQFETTGAPEDDYSLDALGADLVSLAKTLGEGRVHLMGHSFGGLVCQRAVIEAPGEWASLSLLCTGPAALGESPERPFSLLIDALDQGVDLKTIHEVRGQMLGTSHPADIAAFLLRRFTSNSPIALRAMTTDLAEAADGLDDVIATGVPVWVGRGAEDDAWPHQEQAAMAARLGAEVHVIEGAGHSPAVEQPEALAAAWLPFLARC